MSKVSVIFFFHLTIYFVIYKMIPKKYSGSELAGF